MFAQLPSLVRFRFSLAWSRSRLPLLVLIAAMFAGLGTLLWALDRSVKLDQLNAELASNRGQVNPATTAVLVSAKPVLPQFVNTQVAQILHQTADEVHLGLDEVSFSLEEGATTPYLRYRVTMSVSASYPLIRRFVDKLKLSPAELSLDSITCARENIASPGLGCELAFSAFYRKGTNG
ncbi:hypothetical protein [Massilia sp. TS11]|uniref:hypothetical protein n=1 Tax=Massilia sp. TS11 TaxID=2908003 RepID=UPI001EDAF278|nr:hypothetical protein [Massilia sp. TS11]MCG2583853.1 hypothetical protein [Massilia sp. TS11]